MGAVQSVYAVLGLAEDADDAAIERAYRRLIKQYHPDRGGDAARATEINRAYRELRIERNLRDPLDFNEADQAYRTERSAWVLLALVLIVASMLLLFRAAPFAAPVQRPGMPAMPKSGTRKPAPHGVMDQSLNVADVDRAAVTANRLRRTSDEMSLSGRSRACHQQLRSRPTIAQFDRCAAFDLAVVQLQDRDPLRDQGPFSELAVTGRMRSAAALLSDDSVAIDARLDRIRKQVDRALDPAQPN